jgi:hypothetical protein
VKIIFFFYEWRDSTLAVIEKDGFRLELKNIISIYTEHDNINHPEDIGTYEAFDISFSIHQKPVFPSFIRHSFADTNYLRRNEKW